MRFWKPWKARKFAKYHTLAEIPYAAFQVPELSIEALRQLDGERGPHIETRRLQLKPLQSRMQQIKIALIADISLWMLDEYETALQELVNRNLEYAQHMGVYLSHFKIEVETFEATFLKRTQECLQDVQFWWHHDTSSVLYARSHFGLDEVTIYTVREVLDIPFRHLVRDLVCHHRELVQKYGFPSLAENDFQPRFDRAPDAIESLLDEYDALLESGRRLVAQVSALETLDRQEQVQNLWKNA